MAAKKFSSSVYVSIHVTLTAQMEENMLQHPQTFSFSLFSPGRSEEGNEKNQGALKV